MEKYIRLITLVTTGVTEATALAPFSAAVLRLRGELTPFEAKRRFINYLDTISGFSFTLFLSFWQSLGKFLADFGPILNHF